MPSGLWGDLLVAAGTLTVLFLPQVEQLTFTREGRVHLRTLALFLVYLPSRVIRVGFGSILDITLTRWVFGMDTRFRGWGR